MMDEMMEGDGLVKMPPMPFGGGEDSDDEYNSVAGKIC